MMTFPPLALSRVGHGLLQLLPQAAGALLLCWCVATLCMLFSPAAPQWHALPPPAPQTAAALVAQQSWFGRVPDVAALAAPPLEVIGVLGNGKSKHGDFAIVRENGVKIVLQVGRSSPGGWQLLSVSGQGVVVSREGQEQHLSLTSGKATVAVAAPPPGQAAELPMPPPQGDNERLE